MRRRDDERLPSDNLPPVEPPAEPPDAFVIELEITEPTSSQALTGPWNGVTVNVAGKAKIASGSGSIGRVEVQVGSGEFKPAAATQAGWATWSAAEMVTTSGTQAIIARAIDGNGNVARERTVTITTTLEPKPAEPEDPPTDTTPPSVAIVSPQPAETFVLDGAGRAEISIAGRAGDVGAGLDRVEVTVDGLPAEVSKLDGWSNWTVRAPLIGEGRHTVSARAYDGAGLHSTAYVEVATATEPPAPPDVERLLVVLKCQLSSYLGAYGTGHVVKTVSLLPGESTEIAVKSYRRSSERSSEASSILDSTSTDSENSFERLVQQEQSSKRASAESQEWSVAGNATVGWGWGSASVSAGAAGGSNAALEEISKNLMHALGKHSARASSKREVQVNTSREMNREEGEESSSQSRIENINLSRTLNFVFRQMNQEYLSILHLVDVRVAYVRGDEDEREAVTERTSSESGPRMRWSYQEVTLSQVDGLLRQVIVPERRDDVRREIINVLTHVSDYEDEIHSIVEERAVEQPDGTPVPGARYLRFPKRKVSRYTDAATGTEIAVPGVILAVSRNVMRTDGVIADAILGQGESLDAYNKGLQSAVVKARTLENGRQAAALDKDRVAIELVRGNDAERAQVFRKVYPVRGTEGLALATIDANGPGQDGSG